MKTYLLSILFLLFSVSIFGQTLTGLWTGALSNDSATIRKDQSFEIALTQYKNRVYGFSRSTFIVNDTLYYIVKRVGGTIDGDVCEVVDEKVVAHNFPTKPEKGVKVISTFRRNPEDSTWSMDGEWKTNKTKKYYSISGKMALREETNYEQSKIFPHLEELGMADDVAFYKEEKEAPRSIAADRDQLTNAEPKTATIPRKNAEPSSMPVRAEGIAKARTEYPATTIQEKSMVREQEQPPQARTDSKRELVMQEKPVSNPPLVQQKPATTQPPQQKPAVVTTKKPAQEDVAMNELEKKQTLAANTQPKPPITATPVEKQQPPSTSIDTAVASKKQAPDKTIAEKPAISSPLVAKVAERKMAAPQMLTFSSDSLQLSLYDNGEVDGDTVSVLLNGEVILAKQGLKASAIRKTIYVPRGTNDSLTLVLYAENLGSYPPNTGLLVVRDGDNVYQIRFKADLTQNATVIFKRKED